MWYLLHDSNRNVAHSQGLIQVKTFSMSLSCEETMKTSYAIIWFKYSFSTKCNPFIAEKVISYMYLEAASTSSLQEQKLVLWFIHLAYIGGWEGWIDCVALWVTKQCFWTRWIVDRCCFNICALGSSGLGDAHIVMVISNWPAHHTEGPIHQNNG